MVLTNAIGRGATAFCKYWMDSAGVTKDVSMVLIISEILKSKGNNYDFNLNILENKLNHPFFLIIRLSAVGICRAWCAALFGFNVDAAYDGADEGSDGGTAQNLINIILINLNFFRFDVWVL